VLSKGRSASTIPCSNSINTLISLSFACLMIISIINILRLLFRLFRAISTAGKLQIA